MDFQTHQEQARQNTTRLVLLLILGITAIVAIVSLLLIALLYYGSGEVQPLSAIAVAAPVTTLGIVGTSLVKTSQIKGGGGSYVAASMGGRPVDFNTLDGTEKQLANVVEEIAIASGMPVPAVYVLDDEPSINAFAAGWTADNAAVAVTRGTLQHLNRRQLQGVIAHEFAHISNGDMRVKTRIIGWIYGIAILTVLGRIILHNAWLAPRRRDRNDGNGVLIILGVGIGLLVVGWAGTIFARMIQAAVSREREYLADASAVQYTRDPSGIGEALMKIGGMVDSNKIRAAHATEASHLFFSPAMSTAFASHPPLKDRIQRLLPSWDGEYIAPSDIERPAPAASPPPPVRAGMLPGQDGRFGIPGFPLDPTMMGAASGLAGASQAPSPAPSPAPPAPAPGPVTYAGPTFDGPTQAHIEHARSLLARIPEPVQGFLHTRRGAVAAVIGAASSTDPTIRQRHLATAARQTWIEPDYLDAAGRVIIDLDRALQLPAIDIALHSIREIPYEDKQRLIGAIEAIHADDEDIDLFRWVLQRVILRHLQDEYDTGRRGAQYPIGTMHNEAAVVYAVLGYYNSSGEAQAQPSFEAALRRIGASPAPLPAPDQLSFRQLDEALDRLANLDRIGREAFVQGATDVVLHDGVATVDEAEMLRVVADAVRLPVPPLLPA
ncbi:MAG: M48 family metallopeptidase [Actinomycetota bacterium]